MDEENTERKLERRIELDGFDVIQDFFGVSNGTGGVVWDCAVFMALHWDFTAIFQQKSVVELGCGVGYLSMKACRMGASRVIATDIDPDVLDLVRRNCKRNQIDLVETRRLAWGSSIEIENVDFIIASDVLYDPGTHARFLDTLYNIAIPNCTRIIITYRIRHPEA